ncbi:MAG: glycine cleavage system aminomethyltransferase GcvT [Acidimicrobiales bacterium]
MKRSPLYESHLRLGAKVVPFGGWQMPLFYRLGTVGEHLACRSAAVAFDVSHLGTVHIEGPGSYDVLQRSLTNDLSRINPGRAQYTHLLSDEGWVVDDLIVWWISKDSFDVMPNASNTSRVIQALGGQERTQERALIAIQGPKARALLGSISKVAAGVGRFAVGEFEWEGYHCRVAGTGYTGEDGVECSVPTGCALDFWDALRDAGIEPAGLGARDTLRLEAGLPLHGHELGEGITPLQVGLEWVVAFEKGEFIGRTSLEREAKQGVDRKLYGLVSATRQPLREKAKVLAVREGKGARDPGDLIGVVTSGNYSPMLERGIALAFLDASAHVEIGDRVMVEVRGRGVPATIVDTPFWSHEGARR